MSSSGVDGSSARAIIRKFLEENFILGDGIALGDSASLVDGGVLDSTGVVELVSFLETRFDIAIPEKDMSAENLDSVDRICALVATRTSGRWA
jgi:acyl carrier protein